MEKSSVDRIRDRFDRDVERFSNLHTGQSSTIDSPLVLELMAAAVSDLHPHIDELLDIGCGAGNYALKVLHEHPGMAVTLLDLSEPMLVRAQQRLEEAGAGKVTAIQSDVRTVSFDPERYDVVVTGAALHHLRSDDEWRTVMTSVYQALKSGGSFWCFDLVNHDIPEVDRLMWFRYGEYLEASGGPAYRDKVFSYIEEEDTPRSVTYQIDLLKEVGFRARDVVHKNSCFCLYTARK
ncbi:MAG TPA: class I SAM-dependent methyltransferase [Spirochaetia bacterium]|nr:class I SAM-dependent methyltransferase [Spirochaetia bacterium]